MRTVCAACRRVCRGPASACLPHSRAAIGRLVTYGGCVGGKTRRFWLLALGLLGCVTANAGSPVWAIHGEHNTVYLAGSVHLLKAADADLPPGFDRAYKGSKSIVMELAIDKIDPSATAQWMMENGMLK